jgi:hypothetical protein
MTNHRTKYGEIKRNGQGWGEGKNKISKPKKVGQLFAFDFTSF